MNRRTTNALLLVGPLLGAAVAIFVLGAGLDVGPAREGGAESPRTAPAHTPALTPGTTPSPDTSILPTEGTAASTVLVEDFDMLPTGGDVPEWQATDTATLNVAAAPTAVDRSAQLAADGTGSACRPVAKEFASLVADFMVEPLPAERRAALTIELSRDSRVTLTVSAEGADLADSSERVGLEPRTWYRWSVSRDDDSYQVTLSEVDGAELGTAEAKAPRADAERFCIATEAPTRVYLDTLTVEGH